MFGCSAQMIFKKTEKNIFARSCQNKFEKNANSSYLNVWTSVRFLKAPIYSKGWWKIVGETLNNNALSSQWINQYTLFFKMPLTTKWLPLSLSGGDSLWTQIIFCTLHCSSKEETSPNYSFVLPIFPWVCIRLELNSLVLSGLGDYLILIIIKKS